jgi:hypothetical protein
MSKANRLALSLFAMYLDLFFVKSAAYRIRAVGSIHFVTTGFKPLIRKLIKKARALGLAHMRYDS